MSGPFQHPTKQAASGQDQRPSVQIQHKLSIWSWTLISFLLLSFAAALISLFAPIFSENLPGVLTFIASQPLSIRLPLYVWLLLVPFFLWLLWRANKRARQVIEQEEVKEKLAEQRDLVAEVIIEHAVEPLKGIDTKLTATQQGVESLNQLLKGTDRALSPVVITPTDMPRAALLVGRDDVLADLMAKLRAGASISIFALRGMGGVGKTVVAAEAVARLAHEQEVFPGGAAWISCEKLTGPAGLGKLWKRVAQALRLDHVVAEPDSQSRREALAQALSQSKRLLLALDNIEPGLNVEAVVQTLAIDGHTALLLTARQAVALHQLMPVEITPLKAPDARALLVQQLQKHDPTRPTAQDEGAMPDLLEALDGLPLAITLSAAYAGLQRLSLGTVLQEIKQGGLKASAFLQDQPNKQTTQWALLNCFDRSWRVLTASQQLLFGSLSLLTGGSFPRAAALALAETASKVAPSIEPESTPAGDEVALVAYALVEPLAGERRRLHPLLREYAAGQFSKFFEAQTRPVAEAMLDYWITFAEAHSGYDEVAEIEAESVGLTGALMLAHEHSFHVQVLRLAHALKRFWHVHGQLDEETRKARMWALTAAQALGDVDEERWTTHALGVLYRQMGQREEAQTYLERAFKLARQIDDLKGQERELHALGVLYSQMDDWEKAETSLNQAIDLARKRRDPEGERHELHSLGVLAAKREQLKEARQYFESALKISKGLRDKNPLLEAADLRNLGLLIGKNGELAQGRLFIEESLEICRRSNNIYNIGRCYLFLAQLDEGEGNMVGAISNYLNALKYFLNAKSPDAEVVRVELRRLGAIEHINGPQ